MDCGAPQGAGGADRGNGCPLWNEKGRRKGKRRWDGESDVHPVVVTKRKGYRRTAGFDCYRRGASCPGGNLPGALEEISGGEETGYDRYPLPVEPQRIYGFV